MCLVDVNLVPISFIKCDDKFETILVLRINQLICNVSIYYFGQRVFFNTVSHLFINSTQVPIFSNQKKKMKSTEAAPLLVKNKQQSEKEEREKIRWEKMKKVSSMAAPMVAVNMSQFLLQATSTMIVGHRNELSLAGIALGSSFANVTGFGILVSQFFIFIFIFIYPFF